MIDAINQIVQDPWPFLIQSLLAEFLVVVAGVLFAILVRDQWIRWRYGGWKVIIMQPGEPDHVREITPTKAKEIIDTEEELSVYLKGVASSYGWLNCDLITEGRECGMLVEQLEKKRFLIDMAKNPAKPPPTLAQIHAQIAELDGMLAAFDANVGAPSSSPEHPAH